MDDSTPILELPVLDKGVRQWRSMAHLEHSPSFVERTREEFMPGASNPPSGTSRRHFLQLLGASMAMTGLAACRRPVEHIMPFANRPEDTIPGIPLFFATAMPLRGVVRPLLVKSHEGRPTKVEGNPQHPETQGATGVFEQASLLTLYDPDRSRQIRHDNQVATWDTFVQFCQQMASRTTDNRVVILSSPTSSPTVLALRDQITQANGETAWITYRSEGDNAIALGMQRVFGRPLRPRYNFDQADVIVSLDADFLGPAAHNTIQATRSFTQGRKLHTAENNMSRLYVLESAYTVTGSMADHRKRLRSSDIPAVAASLAAHLGLADTSTGTGTSDPFITAMANDLLAAGNRGIVLAGETQPPEIHVLCAVMNDALGSIGGAVTLLETEEETATPQNEALETLVNDIRAGTVDILVILNTNPAYDTPPELGFRDAMRLVGETIHVGLHRDETAQASSWHIPATHYLEAWGDGRAYDGTLSVIQPLIAPLYAETHSEIEVLHTLLTVQYRPGYDIVRDTWRPLLEGNFEHAWRTVLHDGFLPDSSYPEIIATATPAGFLPTFVDPSSLELVIRLDPTILDGSFANNAWCQELPDPMTKIVWDNVAVMSPATAENLGVSAVYSKGRYTVDMVTIQANGHTLDLPVWIMPGHADGSISVTLGYGRTILSNREERTTPFWDTDDVTDVYAKGALCNGIGQNVALLRNRTAAPVTLGVQMQPTGASYSIVTTQDHGILDMEARPLIRTGTLEEFRQNPAFVLDSEAPTPGKDEKTDFSDYPTLWEDRHPSREDAMRDSAYYRNQWGMVIDLNACTGCGACIVACQAENNVQVVGKEEIGNGRELHWLRIDRYFISQEGTALTDDPQIVLQPVPCQHCENAPCESVCPVAATVHSPDGTNQMIYNRCIGTRYCANNCPYKVRRFNYYNWSKTIPETVQMAQNPNVSIRSRGVMEKCSFCIQRVRGAQKRARLEERSLHSNEVVTACQQVCPAEAIVFGDLNDPDSNVVRERNNSRNYTMLAELNVKPRVSYLGRVHNPSAALHSPSS